MVIEVSFRLNRRSPRTDCIRFIIYFGLLLSCLGKKQFLKETGPIIKIEYAFCMLSIVTALILMVTRILKIGDCLYKTAHMKHNILQGESKCFQKIIRIRNKQYRHVAAKTNATLFLYL